MGSCHRHDLFFLSRLHIGEEIIGIVIAEADNRIGDANRSLVRFAVIRRLDDCAVAANGRSDGPRRSIGQAWSMSAKGRVPPLHHSTYNACKLQD